MMPSLVGVLIGKARIQRLCGLADDPFVVAVPGEAKACSAVRRMAAAA
jgi:hypothetical protein